MLTKENIHEIYPLSPMQENMFFHHQIAPDSAAYFEQISYRISGELNPSFVEKSINELIKRHDVLRTVFIQKTKNRPVQVVLKERSADFHYKDISETDDIDSYVSNYKILARDKKFDLGKDVLLRVVVLQIRPNEYEFIWNFHHIIMDGWCLGILHSEFREIYQSLCENRPSILLKPRPYLEFIKWLDQQDYAEHKNHWEKYLSDCHEVATLPASFLVNDASQKYVNEEVKVTLNRKTSDAIRDLSKKNSTTLNNLFQTMWSVLLSKYSGKDDVVFGSVVSGRPIELSGVESMVGLFVNTIPVRSIIDKKSSVLDLLKKSHESNFENQQYSYGSLADIMSWTPLKSKLIDHLFVFENYPLKDKIEQKEEGLKVLNYESFDQTSYHLNVLIFPGEEIDIKFRFNSSVYSKSLIEQLANHFDHLIKKVLRDISTPLEELSILSDEEVKSLIIDQNNTLKDFKGSFSVKELFENQVKQTPDAQALFYEGLSFTYSELNAEANKLAHYLISNFDLQPGAKAIVNLSRSQYGVVTILALSKSGICYVPISPDYPVNLIENIMKQVQGDVLISESEIDNPLFEKENRILLDKLDLNGFDQENPELNIDLESPLYIVYTSGSSGVPKGVIQKHRTFSNLVQWQMEGSGIDKGLRILHYASFTFDVSLQDVFFPLSSGGCIYLLSDAKRADFPAIWEFIDHHDIELLSFPTTVLHNLFKENFGSALKIKSLRHIVTAGEQLVVSENLNTYLAEHPNVALHNHYGPSETHVVTSYTLRGRQILNLKKIPIGKPIDNCRVYILDEHFQPVPKGVFGELFLAGAHIAQGYLGQPTLTNEKFLSAGLSWEKGMVYRSGDIGRWLEDGNIEFLKRKDNQVKVNGYRIELEEIEGAIRMHEQIQYTAVIVKKDKEGDNYLVAFFQSTNKLEHHELKGFLQDKLPPYMLPLVFAETPKMPFTNHGKIDRKALFETSVEHSANKYEPPIGKEENLLVSIWCKILMIEQVSRIDNFFEIGGHSLKAGRLLAYIQKDMQASIELKDIFNYPILKDLAKFISGGEKTDFEAISCIERQASYDLSHAQKRLWIIQEQEKNNVAYNMSASYTLSGHVNIDALEKTFHSIIEKHEILRTVFINKEGTPRQKVVETQDLKIKIAQKDLRSVSETKPVIEEETSLNAKQPFDLTKDFLIRIKLLQLEDRKFILLFTAHHIIFDGWSLNIFFSEISTIYNTLIKEDKVDCDKPKIQYKDYTAWHNACLDEGKFQQHKDFWIKSFKENPPPLNLPLDYNRPKNLTFEGKSIHRQINAETVLKLKSFASKKDISLFMILQAVVKGWVYLITGQKDIVIGSPAACRDHVDLEDQLGFYANTLPLRTTFSEEWTFEQLIEKVSEDTFSAYRYQQYPFDLIIEDLNLKRDRNRSPLFDILFVLQNNDDTFNGLEGIEIENFTSGGISSIYDLSLSMDESDDCIHVNTSFNTSLFKEQTISELVDKLLILVAAVIDHPTTTIGNIATLLPAIDEIPDTAFVLNAHHEPTPVNIIGDVWCEYSEELTKEHLQNISHGGKTLVLTGDKGRRRPDGTVEILGFRPSGFLDDRQYLATHNIESFFYTSELVREIFLTNHQGGADRSFPLAHVVFNDDPNERQLKKHLENHLSSGFVKNIVVNSLDSIPLDDSGYPNLAILNNIYIVQTEDIEAFENSIKAINGVKNAAAIIKDSDQKKQLIHMRDFVSHHSFSFTSQEDDSTLNNESLGSNDLPKDKQALADGGKAQGLYSENPQTLVDAIINTASKFENKGIIILDESSREIRLSYAELLQNAKCYLSGLRAAGLKSGDNIILQIESLPDYLPVLWGSILGGIIPVTIAATGSTSQKLYDTWLLLNKPKIVTDTDFFESLSSYKKKFENQKIELLTIEQLSGHAPDQNLHKSKPEDIVFYQLSSGSTGTSKCIQITHKGIVAHILESQQFNKYEPGDITLNWLPFDHVVPLLTFHTKDLYLGIQQIQVPTSSVIGDPLLWLDLMEKYKVTHSWSPNFGYKLVGEKLLESQSRSWDLKSVKLLMNAGEQVTIHGVRDFINLTSDFGITPSTIQPSFGMAEVCTCMTYNNEFSLSGEYRFKKSPDGQLIPTEEEKGSVSFIDLGPPMAGVQIRITTQNNELLAENFIGRFQIKCASVTPGYYMNSSANEEAFVGDGWFNTGDLGFISNGRLFITGREKEVIIIRGVNYFCYEVEDVVGKVHGVDSTSVACCSYFDDSSGTEGLLVFFVPTQEILPELLENVRHSIAKSIGITPDFIIPVGKAAFPKTTSGKIQRRKLKNLFNEGHFNEKIKEVDILEENKNTTIPEWFYKPVWNAKQKIGEAKQWPETVLLFAHQSFTAHESLKQTKFIKIEPGEAFQKLDLMHYVIRPDQLEDYQLLISELVNNELLPQLVLHAWNYHDDSIDPEETLTLKSQELSICSIQNLMKVWDELIKSNLNLHVLTSFATQVFPNEKIEVAKTSLHGFLKSAALELQSLSYAQIDVPYGQENLETILNDELTSPCEDGEEIAYRNNQRYVRALDKIDLLEGESKDNPTFKEEGLYLITGGLGGIGIHVSQYLVNRYKAHILIIGQTELNDLPTTGKESYSDENTELKIKMLKTLKAKSDYVAYRALDVNDLASIEAYVKEMEGTWDQNLDGVIHLAGNSGSVVAHWEHVDTKLVVNADQENLINTICSRALGTANLFKMLSNRPDTAFINFSSVNSYFGGYSFSAYSAACSMQDYIVLNEAKNREVKTFNWSMWEGTGMNKGNKFTELTVNKGFSALSSIEGINSFEVAMQLNSPQTYIGLNGANKHIKKYLIQKEFKNKELQIFYESEDIREIEEQVFYEISKNKLGIPIRSASVDNLPLDNEGGVDYTKLYSLAKKIGRNKASRQASTIEEAELSLIWEEALNLKGIGVTDNFFVLGGDSLKAMQVTSRIYQIFNVTIGVEKLFEHPNIEQLALLIAANKKEDITEIVPLSSGTSLFASCAQERLWFISNLDEVKAAYNVYAAYTLKGDLNIDALENAIKFLIGRHEALRTTYKIAEGKLHYFVEPELLDFSLNYLDISDRPDKNEFANEVVRNERNQKFDLENGPLIKTTLISTEPNQYVFLLTLHHIIWDAWSENIFMSELFTLYNSYLNGTNVPLAPLNIQYKDCINWQNEQLDSQDVLIQRDYWVNKLEGLPLLNLPTDFSRPAVKTYAGNRIIFNLSDEQSEFVTSFAKENDASVYMVLLSSVKALLYRYTMQEDFAVGIPISGRNHVDMENHIGLFLNTLVLRTKFSKEDGFKELLKKVRKTTLEAYQNRDYPFDLLVNQLNLSRDTSRSPLFDVLVTTVSSTQEDDLAHLPDLSFEVLSEDFLFSKFDLTFSFKEINGQLSGLVEYNTDLFSFEKISRLVDQYKTLLEEVAKDYHKPLNQLDFIPHEQKKKLTLGLEEYTPSYTAFQNINTLLEVQAKATPNKQALIFEDTVYTYAEFNRHVCQLAHYLKTEKQVKKGDYVVVVLERSHLPVISMISIFRLGACYIPIDKEFPQSRIELIINEVNPKVILTQSAISKEIAEEKRINLDQLELDSSSVNFDFQDIAPNDASYIIYTSGSTGTPKGVVQTYLTLSNLIQWDILESGLGRENSLLQYSSFSFDSSLHDALYSLCSGGTIHVVSEQLRLDLKALKQYIIDEKINVISFPFAALRIFIEVNGTHEFLNHSLKHIISTGEQLIVGDKLELFLRKNPEVMLHNFYGPSETHVVTAYAMSGKDKEINKRPPIGKPIANSFILILDESLNILPQGVSGQAYIGGANLALAYFKNESSTDLKFINREIDGRNVRLYTSGDMAYWGDDGNITYLGRQDNQVKILGYRIELGEIEHRLTSHENIEAAVIISKKDKSGLNHIVAYVKLNKELAQQLIRNYLIDHLPSYMIPSYIIVVDKFETSVIGKINQDLLPDPFQIDDTHIEESISAASPTIKSIWSIWKELLGHGQIGVQDSFFDLGGNSIKLISLHQKLDEKFPGKVSVTDLFKYPSIASQASFINNQEEIIEESIEI